ncbi:MAG: hypothetical protein C0467_07850 [Planctomycetaceae bacterium]|nr:hypothetical protein [Planctomycetaceae bacterium]
MKLETIGNGEADATAAPVATGLASERRGGYLTLVRRVVVAIMEEASGAHDARVLDTNDHPVGSPQGPASPGKRFPTVKGMVWIREGAALRSKWVARIVTTGYADGPVYPSHWSQDEDTGPKKPVSLTATGL